MTIQQNRNPDPDPSHHRRRDSGAPLIIDRAGDALALVRHSFGELPRESLVLIGLYNGTSGGHLRMDLAPALQQPRSCAQRAAAWLAGPEADPVPDAVVAAVLTESAPHPEQHHGRAVIDELSEILQHQYQCELLRTWYVGAGSVRDFDCTDARCCPYPGLIVDDELAAALTRSPQLEILTRPTPPEETIETFLRVPLSPSAPSPQQVAALRECAAFHHDINAALHLWEHSITEITTTGGCESVQRPEHAAQLLHSAEDSLLVQSLAPLAAVSIEAASIRSPAEPDRGSWPAQPRPPVTEQCHQQYLAALTGQTDYAPQWARVDALDALLHLLVPYPGPQQVNLVALKGWIEWVKGCGSSATLAVNTCLADQPDHQLAGILAELFDVSGPCQWARVKQHSHGWWRSRQSV